ncbi:hypothetical protein CapIbe_019095 [Capra ibex]
MPLSRGGRSHPWGPQIRGQTAEEPSRAPWAPRRPVLRSAVQASHDPQSSAESASLPGLALGPSSRNGAWNGSSDGFLSNIPTGLDSSSCVLVLGSRQPPDGPCMWGKEEGRSTIAKPVDRPFRLPLSFSADSPSLKLAAWWLTAWSPWLAQKPRSQLPSTIEGRGLCPLPVTDLGPQGALEFQG